ncbi:hypothetical protein AB0952_38305 [Streptomyces caniferus]|uniref:hypothetical protein n=1 Tax=Streptomyces caniferus TaxID=285557 RepID=UPI00345235FD
MSGLWFIEGAFDVITEEAARVAQPEGIKGFGEYCAHELGSQDAAFDPKLDVDFTHLGGQGLTTVVVGKAA